MKGKIGNWNPIIRSQQGNDAEFMATYINCNLLKCYWTQNCTDAVSFAKFSLLHSSS